MNKKHTISLYLIILFSGLLLAGCNKEKSLSATNLDGIDICVEDNIVTYKDGSKEVIDQNYIALFVNGSFIKEAGVLLKNGTPMVPIERIKKELNINSSEEKEHKYIIAPIEINGQTLVGINDIEEILNVKVSYYDTSDETKEHLLANTPQVLINKYSEKEKFLTSKEAINIVKKQLITAYEKQFGQFPEEGDSLVEDTDDDEASYRKLIHNLHVSTQEDRFYIIPVVWDFWVDKYTGDVFVYYNGYNQSINLFDPNSKSALAFAG